MPLITAGQSKQIITAALPSVVAKSGYFYVYVSNESPQDLFFDNVTIQHKRGPLLQEDHYYPFGLGMAGISSKAAQALINKKKYNTWERDEDLDILVDESFYRVNDYQTGRFWQPDPRIESGMEGYTLYASNLDNPISLSDPLGDVPGCCDGDPIVAIGELAKDFFNNGVVPAVAWFNRNLNPVYGAANGIKVLATGKNLDEQKQSTVSGAADLMMAVVPGASLEKGAMKVAEKTLVKDAVEGAEKVVAKDVEAAASKEVKNVAATTSTKLLNQFNSAESLIEGAGKLTKVKAGLQGFVKGDGNSIFKAITNGGTLQSNGQYLMKNGMQIGSHFSKTTRAFSINLTPTVGKMIKIRITP